MDRKILGVIFSLAAMALLTAIVLLSFYSSPKFPVFLAWTQQNTKSFFFILIGLKILGVVYPPVPGSIFTLSAIPIVGWKEAYLAEFTGSVIGASISYFLAKKYGLTLVNKLFGEMAVERVQKIKIKKDKELEAIVILRIIGGNVIEIINYGAGLLGVSYGSFLVASVIAHPIIGVPIYFSAGKIFEGKNLTLYSTFIFLGLTVLYKFRGRYFE